jgi:outer membrane protein TolC
LQWFLRHRLISVALMIGLCAFAGYGMQKVPKMFFADSDKPQFFIDYWMPEGTRIEQTSDSLRLVETHLATLHEIKNFATVIGSAPPRFAPSLNPEAPNPAFGQIIVNVHDYRVIPGLQEKLDLWFIENLPEADPKMRSYISGPPADYKVEARFSGPDPSVLRDLAEQAKAIMRAEPAAKYVRDDWRQRVALWEPVYSQQRAREAGVERKDVAISILRATDGMPVATYREGNDLIPVKVRSFPEDGSGILSPESTPVWGAGPASVPLGQVVDLPGLSWEDPVVRRYDRRRAITIKCDTAGVTSDTLLARVRPLIEAIKLPAAYTLDWGGDYELSAKGNEGVQKFMPLALLMMFFILVVLFNGFRQPIIIVLVVPLALTGMVAGLLFTGQPFGFLALLGAYSLIGMLIKNAVVLIDEIEFAIRDGKAPFEAVVTSSVSRLRPVTMASATTIFGMVPLLKDAMFVSMAVTIMFGLALATVLTLVVVPVLYTLFFRIPPVNPSDTGNRNRKRMFFARIRQSPAIVLICCFFTAAALGRVQASESPSAAMTVDQAVAEALAANPVIRQSRANESAAEFGVESARRDLLPKAVAAYRYTGLGEDPIMKLPTGDRQTAHQNQFSWEISVVQPLFAGFSRVLGLENARLQKQYAGDQTRKTSLDLILDVKDSCYSLLLSQKELAVAEDEVRMLEAHAGDARLFYEQGLIPKNDLLKSRVALAAAVQRCQRAKAGVNVAAARLNTLLNRDQDAAVVLDDITVAPQNVPVLETLYEQALSNRPMLALLRNAAKQLEIATKLAKSPRYPQVNLVGTYSRDGDSPDASENDYSNASNSSVMLEARWTFFQWGKTHADAARARKEKQAVLHQIRDMENRVRFELKSALLELDLAHKNIDTAETALTQAHENYRITDLQYRQQIVNSSEVLDARVYLTEAEKNFHEAQYGYLNALARLDRTVGWKKGSEQ